MVKSLRGQTFPSILHQHQRGIQRSIREVYRVKKMTILQLDKVDFQLRANTEAHRTNDYITTELVVRRGQGFNINLFFNRPVDSRDRLTVTVETGNSPSETNGTKAEMPVSIYGSGTAWSAVRGYISGNSKTITINSLVTAVVGRYRMSLQMSSGGRSSSSNLGNFVLLFNPWASDDEVFMSNESERKEYVLNEFGMYWYGNPNDPKSKGWGYGQFDSDILDIVLTLLDRGLVRYELDNSLQRNPLQVGRMMSAMVNSNGVDNGVLVGRWSEDNNYTGGVSPSEWNGSVRILRQWMNSGRPVKFGQCFVFAGVLCTVLRCLGIPARVITNFESAHDTDRKLFIDFYYKDMARTILDRDKTKNSIWNYHLWNEMWSVRKDLRSDFGYSYNGWQIVDATPQEQSEGIYRLGPCSLKAVKEGDVHLNYDTPFVFAEVQAHVRKWKPKLDGTYEYIDNGSEGVGVLTTTKAVGSPERVDITNDYKYTDEANKSAVFQRACGIMHPRVLAANATMPEEVAVKHEFTGAFKNKNGETQVGKDLTMELTLKNTTAITRTVKVNMTATAIIYNSTPFKVILTQSQTVKLGANEEKKIPLIITYAQYKMALTPDNMIEVVAVCEDDKGGKLLVDKVETMKNPPLLIRFNQKAVLKKKSTVDVIFTNPIGEDVNDCTLIIEGSGLVEKYHVSHEGLLKKNATLTMKVVIEPYRVGKRYLLADFSSTKFPNVKGFQSVVVEAQ